MEIVQGSDEWKEIRLGKVTASRIADVMSKGRGSAESAGVRNYRAQLVAERLTGNVEETFCSSDMQRGIDLEPEARKLYEFQTDFAVGEIAFVPHPAIESSGCSPDGLILSDSDIVGLVEIKAPKTANHIDNILSGSADPKYIKQMQWQMACTGAKWCDFVSYDPTMPPDMQLYVSRVDRDEKLIKEMESAVVKFLFSVDRMIQDLKASI